MIDFNDPGQTTHNGQPIPINTQEKYDAGEAILQAIYGYVGVEWTDASAARYEERVRAGQDLREIIVNTYDEYLERTDQKAQPK